MPHEPRCLVLDEGINWKLARELRRRGLRGSTSSHELGLLAKQDPAVFKALAEKHEPCVLVAWDNKMPLSHAVALKHFEITLAVVDRKAKRGDLSEQEYYREVIHRWAHRMVFQPPGTVVKYSRTRSAKVELQVPALAAA